MAGSHSAQRKVFDSVRGADREDYNPGRDWRVILDVEELPHCLAEEFDFVPGSVQVGWFEPHRTVVPPRTTAISYAAGVDTAPLSHHTGT
jgi:hypothetical protein